MDKKLVFEKALEALKEMKGVECASFCWAFAYAICSIQTGKDLASIIEGNNDPDCYVPEHLDYLLGVTFVVKNLSHRRPLLNMDLAYWFPRNDFDIRIKILEEEIALME